MFFLLKFINKSENKTGVKELIREVKAAVDLD